MENKIISSILSKNDKDIILKDEQLNISSENNFDSENNLNKSQNESKNNNLEKAKELLQKLLKESLENKLVLSEKNAKLHFLKIKTTSELTKSITNLTIKMGKQIQEKIKKDKEKQSKLKSNKASGNKKGFSPRKSAIGNKTQISFYRAKTPSHTMKKGNNKINGKTSIMGLKRNLMKNKSNTSLIKSSKTLDVKKLNRRNIRHRNMDSKTKSSINIKKYQNNNDSNMEDLQTISVTSIKTNKTNATALNTITNSRINNKYPLSKNGNKIKKDNVDLNLKSNIDRAKGMKILNKNIANNNFNLSEKNIIHIKKKKNNVNNNNNLTTEEKRKRKKTPFTKKKNNNNNIDNESLKINYTSKKKERTIEDEIDDILSMECNLQKEAGLNNDDPLLILPLKDLDFVPKGLLRRNSVRKDNFNKERNYILSTFNIMQNLDKIEFDQHTFKYLSLKDLLSIKNINKKFRQLVILYLIEYLEKERIEINEIINNLNIKEIPNREGIENLVLSKGSKKAINLLNESQLNHLFRDGNMPINDIILIYRIYFQIINHPFALMAKDDIEKFWEKCRNYFSNEQNCKTGDILIAMINDKKIDVNGNNLYKIYNLVKSNLNKIIPNYYTDICGTTGLFVFIIKDILEFLGISQKIKKIDNAYWTYSDIIEAINERINYLKNYSN